MVECAGLEIRCTVMPYRGFESHLLRHVVKASENQGPFSCPRPVCPPLRASDCQCAAPCMDRIKLATRPGTRQPAEASKANRLINYCT